MRILTISLIMFVILLPLSSAQELQTKFDEPQTDQEEYANEQVATKVLCAAVKVERTDIYNPIGVGDFISPELVVTGDLERVAKNTLRMNINDKLCGFIDRTEILINSVLVYDQWEQKYIFSLYRDRYCEDVCYKVANVLVDNEYNRKAMKALFQAKLDYYSLYSNCIFVGQEEKVYKDLKCEIKINEIQKGSYWQSDKTFTAYESYRYRQSHLQPQIFKQPRIYFVNAIEPKLINDKYLGNYVWSLPKEMLPSVKEASTHGDEFPKVKVKNDKGETIEIPEVIFQGSAEETIYLLGSSSKAAIVLSNHTLSYIEDNKLFGKVVETIRKNMFAVREDQNYTLLYQLINILKNSDTERSRNTIKELLHEYFEMIESGKSEPAENHETNYWELEEERTDVNHSLAWLLLCLTQEDVIKNYGQKLLALKKTATNRWKEEIQLALDVQKVEDYYELEAALERMKAAKPRFSRTQFRSPEGEIDSFCFSKSGKFLATSDYVLIQIWNINDWSQVTSFKIKEEIRAFSKDDKYLYVGSGDFYKIEIATGEIMQTYKGHDGYIRAFKISDDEKTMITASESDDKIFVWDLESAKILKKIDIPKDFYISDISSDCKRIGLVHNENDVMGVINVDKPDEPMKKSLLYSNNLFKIAFTDDEKHILTLECENDNAWRSEKPEKYIISMQSTEERFKVIAATGFTMLSGEEGWSISSDKKYIAVANYINAVFVFSLPELKLVKEIKYKLVDRFAYSSDGDRSIAFSGDGKYLLINDNYRPIPRLYDVSKNFQEVDIIAGHGASIIDWYISEDGKRIISIDEEDIICHWDAKTLKLIKKNEIPIEFNVASIQKPGAKYAMCFDPSNGDYDSWDDEVDTELKFFIYNIETQDKVCDLVFPTNYWSSRVFWIDDDEAILLTENGSFRFNYLTGKIVKKLDIDEMVVINLWGEVSEDRSSIIDIDGGCKDSTVSIRKLDLTTGAYTYGESADLETMTGNANGIVPGGKYFYIGAPGLYIYDRKTAKLVAKNAFKDDWLYSISFNRDGSKYVVSLSPSEDYAFTNSSLNIDPDSEYLIRVHDTSTSKTLYAFKVKNHWVRAKLTADSKQVIVLNRDNSFELWDLPEFKENAED